MNCENECCLQKVAKNPDKSGSIAGLYKKQLKIKKANHI